MGYGSGNRMLEYGGQTLGHDLDGNMTWGPLDGIFSSFAYDQKNQLVQAGQTTYQYDGEGTRLSARDSRGTAAYVTDPVSALSQVLLSQNPDGSSTVYVYGLGLISQETVKGGSREYRTYHHDYRGSTVLMADEAGRVTDTVSYDPYGSITDRTGSTKTPFLYVGRYGVQTEENGLLYMRARYYSPELNRFVSADPVRDGLNWYIYGDSNPINSIDPLGTVSAQQRGKDWAEYGGAMVTGFNQSVSDFKNTREATQGTAAGKLYNIPVVGYLSYSAVVSTKSRYMEFKANPTAFALADTILMGIPSTVKGALSPED